MVVFDIETGPLPLYKLQPLIPPFEETTSPFDPASVKCGNLKDAAKIEEKIEAARLAHEANAAGIPQRREAHIQAFVDRAALRANTGQVLAIGYKINGGDPIICWAEESGGECYLLNDFWRAVERQTITNGDAVHAIHDQLPFVGHNIFGFDLPFLVRRSWLLNVPVPASVRSGRYWSPIFVDTMDIWGCGSREMVSLDELAASFGLAGKNGDGGEFAKLAATDRAAAAAYLANDLRLTYEVATCLQLL